jgi:hypothetical protein
VVLVRVGDRQFEVSSLEDLERLCRALRDEILSRRQCHGSWYIRVPPGRLEAILERAYLRSLRGELGVSGAVAELLSEGGLSKSLARVITPTLSSLGLASMGVFTKEAVEIGRLLHEGRADAARLRLRELARNNCVLREIAERARDCSDLERAAAEVLAYYGRTPRRDEVRYTAELIRMLEPRCWHCDLKCASPERVRACAGEILRLLAPHLREALERLDVPLTPERLKCVGVGESTALIVARDTGRPVGLAIIGGPLEGADPHRLRELLARMERLVTEGAYDIYVKVVPVLEGSGGCRQLKLFVEVVRGDLERLSKFVRIGP